VEPPLQILRSEGPGSVLCGIAGYSLSVGSRVDRTLAAQTLLAAISERGADAVGYAYRGPALPLAVHKQRTGASELLETISVPSAARQALIHVRDYTKGHPSIAANNHPIRHGVVVGIHNGIIANDEEIFASYGFERAEADMTVDSEAIFALMERHHHRASALAELYGSMASAWVDDTEPETIFAARGMGRPLWLGEGKNELFFASTREALELVERYAGLRLRKREVPEGTLTTIVDGHVARAESFQPDTSFTEQLLPAVRAPEERRSCLARLAALAAPATAR
jgi:glucosamine 6-phosphate synthetase-like amidotransferase/phosphosugar isomerase protein